MSERPLIQVVDDDDSLREALLRLLDAAGFEVRGYASAGEFLLAPPLDRHGCLLLDVRMPGPSGLDLQAALQRLGIGLPVVFLSGQSDVGAGVRAMKSGAVDFLSKPVEREALLDAVGRALERDRAARAEREKEARLRESFASLTARELEVFELLVQGRLNKQIGGTLGIAERTVKAHRASLMAKLGAGSPAELGVLAERLRLLAEGATAES